MKIVQNVVALFGDARKGNLKILERSAPLWVGWVGEVRALTGDAAGVKYAVYQCVLPCSTGGGRSQGYTCV